MKFAFSRVVRMPAEQNHPDCTYEGRKSENEAGLRIAVAQLGDQGRQEQGNGIGRPLHRKICEGAHQDADIEHRFRETGMCSLCDKDLLLVDCVDQPVDFVFPKPSGIARIVGQVQIHGNGQQHRGQSLEDIHPLPAFHPQASDIQQQARNRCADDGRHRDRQHKKSDHAGTIGRRKPSGQVKNHARIETGFAQAQQKAQKVEAHVRAQPGIAGYLRNKAERGGYHAPAQHDPGNPHPCPETLQQDV